MRCVGTEKNVVFKGCVCECVQSAGTECHVLCKGELVNVYKFLVRKGMLCVGFVGECAQCAGTDKDVLSKGVFVDCLLVAGT